MTLAALAAAAPVAVAQAPSGKTLVNTRKGIALQGFDPVAFFTESKPVKGNPSITAVDKGATYYFATAEHRDAFLKDPAKYAPQYGGYCAYGMSQGHAAPVEIDTWQIVDGRLMLNYSKDVRKKFDADRAALIKQADANWPKVLDEKGSK
jgi:YHS domain-containing protein